MQHQSRGFIAIACALGALLATALANAAAPEYSVIAITPSSPVTSIGYDLNDSGQIVGTLDRKSVV